MVKLPLLCHKLANSKGKLTMTVSAPSSSSLHDYEDDYEDYYDPLYYMKGDHGSCAENNRIGNSNFSQVRSTPAALTPPRSSPCMEEVVRRRTPAWISRLLKTNLPEAVELEDLFGNMLVLGRIAEVVHGVLDACVEGDGGGGGREGGREGGGDADGDGNGNGNGNVSTPMPLRGRRGITADVSPPPGGHRAVGIAGYRILPTHSRTHALTLFVRHDVLCSMLLRRILPPCRCVRSIFRWGSGRIG